MSDTEPAPTSPDLSGETKVKESPKPVFKIKTLDDLKNIMVVAKGGDPNAIQAITKFMNFESVTERSFFPDKTLTLCVGQLNGLGRVYFAGEEWDPFTLIGDVLSIAFMGYKGFKSEQLVDLMRQTPNLDALQTTGEEIKQGVIARILGRVKSE